MITDNIFKKFTTTVNKLARSRAGSIAPIMALMLPLILGAGGLTMDYAFMRLKVSQLQDAADVAAIAATQELSIALRSTNYIDSVVKSYVAGAFSDTENLTVASTVQGTSKDIVAVNLSLKWTPFFAQFFNSDVTPIVVSAKAQLAGVDKICVLGLLPSRLAAIHLDNNSRLTAPSCGVYSNSTSVGSLRADGLSKGIASTFCATGGYLKFGSASMTPRPQTDCPVIPDPLAGRTKPDIGACTHSRYEVNYSSTLQPGTYCGGLTISGNAQVNLEPGIYIIKDGPLIVKDTAGIKGVGVGFFLTGAGSVFDFQSGSKIDLKAPVTGNLAGLLFYEDQNVPYSFRFNPFALNRLPSNVRLHKVSSNDARQLLGTIYLSRSILLVDANEAVAADSAYTAIVVGRLWLQQGPNLVLNADYSVTDVPVPIGLSGGRSRLIE